jgi:hypothetical protein
MDQPRRDRVRPNSGERHDSALRELSSRDDGDELRETDPMPTERRAPCRRNLAREFIGGVDRGADDEEFLISLARFQPGACALYPATTGSGSDGKQVHGNKTIH